MRTLTLFILLFIPLAKAQETRPLPGMQEAMADMVTGKYRAREASASPWNEDILVTASHIDAVIENEVCNSPYFDTKFVHKTTGQSVTWRQPIAMEDVEFHGKLTIVNETRTMSMDVEMKSLGKALRNTYITHNGKELDFVWLGAGKVIKGMSGGPVIAVSDGAIVGMIIGMPVPGLRKYTVEEDKYHDLNLFVPYKTVKEVWENCNNH